MMHEAAVREDHALIRNGLTGSSATPCTPGISPCYSGCTKKVSGTLHLAQDPSSARKPKVPDTFFVQSGVASLNICLWLLWPVALMGILIQAASEEQLLGERFGQDHDCYVRRTGRLVPRLWGQAADLHATPNRGGG